MLREQAKEKTKCERIMKDRYGKKEYITQMKIGEVRKYFKTRVGLLPFANNYKNDLQEPSGCAGVRKIRKTSLT